MGDTVIDIPTCKICLEGEGDGEEMKLVNYCQCKGSVKWTHKVCLDRWMQESDECKECKTKYTIINNVEVKENTESDSKCYRISKRLLATILLSFFLSTVLFNVSHFGITLFSSWLIVLGVVIFIVGIFGNLKMFKSCLPESRLQNIVTSQSYLGIFYHSLLFSLGVVQIIALCCLFFYVGFVVYVFEIKIGN
jgi:hypothetical protein